MKPVRTLLALGLSMAALAADWPQFRGTARDGVAPGGGFGSGWSESGPRVLWKAETGSAFSQLVVRGGAAYTGVSDEEREFLVRLDAATGKEVWRTPVGERFADSFGAGPRSTPTLDGGRIYFLGAKGKLVAVSADDGALVWSVDLPTEFGAEIPRFGFAGSPLVLDDLLLLEVGGKDDAALVAFDKKSGEKKWAALSGPAGYGSAILADILGSRQIVLVRGKKVLALDAAGKVLWSHDLEEPAIAMPVPVGDGRIFVSSMGDTGCAMLKIAKGENGFEVAELWKNRDMRNHFNSSLIHDGHIYGFDNATLKCLSVETGEVLWVKRGFGKGSVSLAGDRLLVLSDHGVFALVEATPSEYRELGTFQALEGRSWTAPSFAEGRVYLRNLTQSTCLDLRSGA